MAASSPEIKEFATFTDDLLRLREWLGVNDCPVVAMESTGVYWRPVHNVLEGQVTVILVNARHIKNVPGRKTDVADSQWLGLLKGSFLPPQEVRQWRELARLRKHYQESIADFKRQVHKLLESANIKLAASPYRHLRGHESTDLGAPGPPGWDTGPV
jgi:transposase